MRRMQAALSSFGIATGIAAVVLLVSIVSGMHHFMLETDRRGRRQHDSGDDVGAAIDARSARVPGDAARRRPGRRSSQSVRYYDIGMAEN